MKTSILISFIFTISFTSFSQSCSLGEVSSRIKETSIEKHKLYVKVTNHCQDERNIIISIMNSKGDYVNTGSKVVGPGESYETYEYTNSKKYRYAILNKNQSVFHAEDESLWIYKK